VQEEEAVEEVVQEALTLVVVGLVGLQVVQLCLMLF
jgi:hypothetical protein